MDWLRSWHEGETEWVPFVAPNKGEHDFLVVLSDAANIVEECMDLPWETVAKLLGSFRKVVDVRGRWKFRN
jgi:hypothetical protein